MRIKNLTDRPQTLNLRDMNLYYLSVIPAGGFIDIDPTITITNLEKLQQSARVAVEGISVKEDVVVEVAEEIKITEGDEGDVESSDTPVDDKHICDICGAEFASARGLASHKNRTHQE